LEDVIASHRGVEDVDKASSIRWRTDFCQRLLRMIKREVFEKSDYFDEKYFLYYEDNDLKPTGKKGRL